MKPRQADAAPITQDGLERAALRYLERYASSAANLRRVLLRRVMRAAAGDEAELARGAALIDSVVGRCVAAGLVDDRRYAEARAAGLARSGASRYRIRGTLLQKGVAAADIDGALAALDDRGGQSELAAACALIRKKRLGPYRAAEARAAYRQKDLAALSRAGFALDLARRLLNQPDAETLEALARAEGEGS